MDRYTVIHSANNEIDTELKTDAELVLKLKLISGALLYIRGRSQTPANQALSGDFAGPITRFPKFGIASRTSDAKILDKTGMILFA